MKRHGYVAIVGVFLLLAAAVGGWCADNQLTVTQDESSMEQAMGRYLKNAHGMTIEEKLYNGDPNDIYLMFYYQGPGLPNARMEIDTQSLNNDPDTKRVLERGMVINLFTGVTVPAGRMDQANAAINQWNRDKTFSSIYIDSDGEVICCWMLNVMKEGLATEYVYDAVVRVQNTWKNLHPVLKAAID
jgi:hypothetical protein